jgi:hypothetical protein
MGESNPLNSLIGRSIGGAFAGAVFGSFAQMMFAWEEPLPGEIRLPWMGALIGALLVGSLSAAVGRRALPNWLRRLAVGLLAGVTIGVLVGALVFAPVMTVIEAGNNELLRGKIFAVFQQIGIALGAVTGGVIGLCVGAVVWLHTRCTGQKTQG